MLPWHWSGSLGSVKEKVKTLEIYPLKINIHTYNRELKSKKVNKKDVIKKCIVEQFLKPLAVDMFGHMKIHVSTKAVLDDIRYRLERRRA